MSDAVLAAEVLATVAAVGGIESSSVAEGHIRSRAAVARAAR
jgi:hypothetical protein